MRMIRCDQVVAEPITAVGLLTWVYRDQKADVMSGKELHAAETGTADSETYHGGWSADGCAAIAEIARVGAIVRGTGQHQYPALHPDAEAVHDRVVALSRTDPLGARLLLVHGRRGDTPEFGTTIPAPGPVRRRTGNNRLQIVEDATLPGNSHLERRERRIRGTARRSRVWVEVHYPFCPLSYSPSFEAAAETQAEYQAWWRALARVAAGLPPLRRWRLAGLGANETPWQRRPKAAAPLSLSLPAPAGSDPPPSVSARMATGGPPARQSGKRA